MEPYRSRIPGFYQLTPSSRKQYLQKQMGFPSNLLDSFSSCSLTEGAADKMVENAFGVFGFPLGVAVNFLVDDWPVVVPMAIEEPSVIAACSHMAKIAGLCGGFHTQVDPPVMMGQIQVLDLLDAENAFSKIQEHQEELIKAANELCVSMVQRGGGCIKVAPKLLPSHQGLYASHDEHKPMLIVEVWVNTCDAMGANLVNTLLEGLMEKVALITKGRVNLGIISNLSDQRMASAVCEIPYRLLGVDAQHDTGKIVAEAVVDAYRFALRDPYRACTHNKGIMNGIDALAIATGNDFRALEAGAHAYACKSGQYLPLTHYVLDDKRGLLKAWIQMPLAVGVVGGIRQIHPTVEACLKLLGPFGENARSLARLMVSVGLAQNMGALYALVGDGIQKGHMKLHERKYV